MENSIKKYLHKFYSLLYDNIKQDYKLTDNSIILSFIKSRNSTRYSILRKSSISATLIPSNELGKLIKNSMCLAHR